MVIEEQLIHRGTLEFQTFDTSVVHVNTEHMFIKRLIFHIKCFEIIASSTYLFEENKKQNEKDSLELAAFVSL
jgi:hypothetical protein